MAYLFLPVWEDHAEMDEGDLQELSAHEKEMNDYVTPAERLRPPSKITRFIGEVWLRYQYKIACFEMDRQAKHAAQWRWVQLQCEDKLRQMGVDPNEMPEDWTRMFEVYVLIAIVLGFALLGFLYSAYKGALLELIRGAM